jgi:hypothetical protein
MKLDDVFWYVLPVTNTVKDYFNATYLDRENLNASFDIDFRVFDEEMSPRNSHSDTLEHYYSGGLISTNYTEFGNTELDRRYNVNSGFLRVEITGNTLYNASGTDLGTFADTTFTVKIDRLSYFDDVYNDPDSVFERSLVTTEGLETTFVLNGSKNQIIYIYDYTTSTTPAGYRLQLDSVNATYTVRGFVGWTNANNHAYEWFEQTSDEMFTINNETHYIENLEFGTNEAIKFAFVVIIDSPVNGTFNLFIEEYQVLETPGVTLQSLGMVEYPFEISAVGDGSKDDNGNFLGGNGLIIGGAAVGVMVIGGVAYAIYKKRSGI